MLDVLLLSGVLLLPFVLTPLRVTSPFGYICFFVGLMFIGKFIYNQTWGTTFLLSMDPEDITKTFRPMAAYLAVAFVIALPFCRDRAFARVNDERRSDPRNLIRHAEMEPTFLARIFLLLAPVTLLTIGTVQGVNPIQNPLGFRQLIQSQGMLYLLSMYMFLLALISIYVPYVIIVLRKRPSIGTILLYLVAAAFAVISGFASMIAQVILLPLFFWSVCYRKRIELWIALLLPVIIVFTLFYSAYRDANFFGSRITLSDAVQTIEDRPDAAKLALNRFDYLETYAAGHIYLESVDPDWGASMFGAVLQPIPRLLWPDKPVTFSTYMTQQLLPQNFEIGVTANFNSLNEFTRSFGSVGILLGGLVLAIILVISYAVFSSAWRNPYLATYYVTVVFAYVNSGFVGGFVNDQGLFLFILNNLYFLLFVRRERLLSVFSAPAPALANS